MFNNKLAITNRITLLEIRNKDNSRIIAKLKRKLVKLNGEH